MSLQIVVQHDQRRAELLPRLLPHLPGAQVVTAEPGSCWRTYLACLSALDDDASHLLCIQDDAVPCLDFLPTVERAIAAKPAEILCLFVPGVNVLQRAVLDACNRGEHWAELPKQSFVPVVANVYPRETVEALLQFEAQNPFNARRISDDANIAEFVRRTGRRVLATVPSLVDHDDSVRSLVGTQHTHGRNPTRVAACWTGEDWSPSEIDWTH